jgi:outer membrane protein OmpA-like peptidoglycan-associated protein
MRATGALMRAQPEAMQTMLRLVQERSGSVAEVLLANGVSESTRQKLVAKLH